MDQIPSKKHKLRGEKKNFTYDVLAEKYKVNKYYLWMIINRPEYNPPLWVRRKLGWIHKRPRRVAIHCSDIKSAASTITNNLDPEDIFDLSEMLSDWCIGHWGNGRILTRAEIEDTK